MKIFESTLLENYTIDTKEYFLENYTIICGHENIRVDAVGELHNHLLRHNLDVVHIEKNFFDNLMNTILNIQGKTNDILKSKLDLVDICARSELHVDENGMAPFPIYRLDGKCK